MLDICDDIDELNGAYANITHKYVMKATYGRKPEALLSDMIRLYTYIKILERNQPTITHQRVKVPVQGQKVSFSSLKKQNNNLILDTEHFTSCSEIESRPCLSDEEICIIVERAKLLSYSYI